MKVEFKKHNIEYERLQSDYLAKPNSAILGKMYLIASEYCVNAILQYTHQKGLQWSDDTIQEKAHDCATWLIEPYLRKEFRIEKLSSYAHFALLKILYQNKDAEMRSMSLDSLIDKWGDHWYENYFEEANDDE